MSIASIDSDSGNENENHKKPIVLGPHASKVLKEKNDKNLERGNLSGGK